MSGLASGNDSPLVLFGFGEETGSVWLDDVKLQSGSLDVWRRDYTGGTVLLNAGSTAQLIPLGSTYKKIKGSQVQAVNDGSYVSQVSLPAQDGLILLRVGNTKNYLPYVVGSK